MHVSSLWVPALLAAIAIGCGKKGGGGGGGTPAKPTEAAPPASTATSTDNPGGDGTDDDGGSTTKDEDDDDDGGGSSLKKKVAALVPANVPAGAGSLALTLPDSLDSASGSSLALQGDIPPPPEMDGGGDGGGGNESQSQGLSQLQFAVEGLEGQISVAVKNGLACDQIWTAMVAKCDADSPGWNTCTAEAGAHKIKVTPEYLAAVYEVTGAELSQSVPADGAALQGELDGEFEFDPAFEDSGSFESGEDVAGNFGANMVSELAGMLGDEMDSPKCVIKKNITGDPDGMTNSVTVETDASNLTSIAWNDDKSKTRTELNSSFSSADLGESSEMSFSFSSKYRVVFNVQTGEMSAVGQHSTTFGQNVDKFTDEFSLKKNPDAADKHGVIGYFKQEGNGFNMTSNFAVDDDGGKISTTYTMVQVTLAGLTLSSAVEANNSYYLAPTGVKGEAIYFKSVGSFWSMDATASPEGVAYWGPSTLPSGLKVYKESFDMSEPSDMSAPMGPSVEETAITVTGGTVQKETTSFSYVETWSADGELTSAGEVDENGNVTYFFGADAAAGYNSYGGEIDAFLADRIKITVSGTNTQAVGADSLYIFSATADVSGVDPFDYAALDAAGLIGQGWFAGDWEQQSTTDLTGYMFEYFGTADEVATAKVYRVVFAQDAFELQLVSGATVAVEQ